MISEGGMPMRMARPDGVGADSHCRSCVGGKAGPSESHETGN